MRGATSPQRTGGEAGEESGFRLLSRTSPALPQALPLCLPKTSALSGGCSLPTLSLASVRVSVHVCVCVCMRLFACVSV